MTVGKLLQQQEKTRPFDFLRQELENDRFPAQKLDIAVEGSADSDFPSFFCFGYCFFFRTVYSIYVNCCMGVSRFRLVALNVNCIPRMIVGLVNHRSIQ